MNPTELPEAFNPEPPMTDVHECLFAASEASKSTTPMVNFSVRIPEQLKRQAQQICEVNVTDLGTFLRECARALVRDYGAKTEE